MPRTKKPGTKLPRKSASTSGTVAEGHCLCGAVRIEIRVPVFWAWHDHGRATQRAQGCAYATYVGCWKSKLRVVKGAKKIASFEDPRNGAVRSFCATCGTPLLYERVGRGKIINIPRALFDAYGTRADLSPQFRGKRRMGIQRRAAQAAEGLSGRVMDRRKAKASGYIRSDGIAACRP